MAEAWLPVVGFEDLYDVSDHGSVRSTRRKGSAGGLLSAGSSGPGYQKVNLYRGGLGTSVYVHRLVLEAFVGPCPPGQEGCHENGEYSENHLSNLRWGTRSENYADAVRHGTAATGSRNGRYRFDDESRRLARDMRKTGRRVVEIAAILGSSPQHASAMSRGLRK